MGNVAMIGSGVTGDVRQTVRTRLMASNNELMLIRNRLDAMLSRSGMLDASIKNAPTTATQPDGDDLLSQIAVLERTASELHNLLEKSEGIA